MSVKTKKKKAKQIQLPAIRVKNAAWEQGIRIKGLSALTGKRVTLGEIYTNLMLEHGPDMEKKLEKAYLSIREKIKRTG